MYQSSSFRYGQDSNLDCQILELPYKGDEMSMLIFLPNKRDGLPELEKKIKDFNFAYYDQKLHVVDVDLTLPRFRIESKTDMKKILQEVILIYNTMKNIVVIYNFLIFRWD